MWVSISHVDITGPGWSRRRRGRGFSYIDETGKAITDPQMLERCRQLVIPPAWNDVWICPKATGHVLAAGVDEAGRSQRIYHPQWRAQRDEYKWERIIEFAQGLPDVRSQVHDTLGSPKANRLDRDRVLAACVRMLDMGLFRIGSERYDSYGLATLKRRHLAVDGDALSFDYTAKSGVRRQITITDRQLKSVLEPLRARGGPGELLAWKDHGRWHDVRSSDINRYLQEISGLEITAKDFRSWHGTVLAAVALSQLDPTDLDYADVGSQIEPDSEARAVAQVAEYLGNTPAVCRASYIHPRVLERYSEGVTIDPALHHIQAADDRQRAVEAAVIALVNGRSTTTIGRAAQNA